MKKSLIIFLIILFASSSFGQSSWNLIRIDFTINLRTVKFFDAQTGYTLSENCIYKSTNGGINWNPIYCDKISDIFMCSPLIMYRSYSGTYSSAFAKTTNGGYDWVTLISGSQQSLGNIFFYDENTGWVSNSSDLLYITTNGSNFYTTTLPTNIGSNKPIYFTNQNTGYFIGSNRYLYKSTNKGFNWVQWGLPDMYMSNYTFTDSSTGYMCGYYASSVPGLIKKTTNGGVNWTEILRDTASSIPKISFVNSYTGYAVAGSKKLYRTTNGGLNWSMQIPDTSSLASIIGIHFIDAYTGWLVGNYGAVLYTSNGGSTFSEEPVAAVPDKFRLGQNYPNPFNNSSKFKFETGKLGNVKISVYDIQGREVQIILNKKLIPGIYEVNFDGSGLNSGVYFYKMSAGNYNETKRMILMK